MEGWSIHVTFLLLVLTTVPSLAQERTDTEAKDQYGDISCVLNSDGIIEATIFVLKNNSKISRVYFSYDNFTEYDGDDCQFNGTGELSDPFTAKVQIDPATDMPPAGRDYCGHTVIETGDTYEWRVYTQRLENFHMDGNVVFLFRCNTLPTNVSVTLVNLGREVIELPSTIGTIRLEMLAEPSPTAIVLTQINIGNDYFPSLSFQPSLPSSSVVDVNLYPWGAYCERLFVSPDNNPLRQVEMLDSNGCPNTAKALAGPFVGTKPPVGNIFHAYAGPLEAWRFDKTPQYPQTVSNTLLFTCHARLCWRPDDTNCINRCPTAGRKKRSTDEYEQLYLVTGTVDLTEEEVPDKTMAPTTAAPVTTTTKTTNNDREVGELVYIISGVGGAVVLLFLVIAVCCIRRSRRRKTFKYRNYVENISITSSTAPMADKLDGRKSHF